MLPYISTNPVTDTIKQNTEVANQRAEKLYQLDQARQRDEALRQGAAIYAEPAPVAPQPTIVPQAGPTAPPPVTIPFKQQPAAPLPDVVTNYPAPEDTRGRRALQVFSSTPGMGDVAMNVAQHQQTQQLEQQKLHNVSLDHVHTLISSGDIQGAKLYAQMHQLNEVLPLFQNPKALATVQSLGAFAHKTLGLEGRDAAKFSETALQAMSGGASYQDAFASAYKGVANSNPEIRHIETNDQGELTGIGKHGEVVPLGKGGKTKTQPQGRDAATAKNVQRTFVGGDGFMWAVLKNGETKQLVDPNGDPVKSNEMNRFAGQVYLKNADMPGASVENARGVSEQLYGPKQKPTGKTLDFVPGQGFVPSQK